MIIRGILIGLIAGIIDVLPMVLKKMEKRACLSAFSHWVVLGVIIPWVDWDMVPWMKGMIIALLTLIPVASLVFPQDKKAIIPMVLFSLILGAGAGWAGDFFITV